MSHSPTQQPSEPSAAEKSSQLSCDQAIPSTENQAMADAINTSLVEVIDLTSGGDTPEPPEGKSQLHEAEARVKTEPSDSAGAALVSHTIPLIQFDPETPTTGAELTKDANITEFADNDDIESVDFSDFQRDEHQRAQEYLEICKDSNMEEYPDAFTVCMDIDQRNDFDIEMEHEEEQKKFETYRQQYEGRKQRGETTVSEEIEFRKARWTELERLRRRERKEEYKKSEQEWDSLFCSDGEQEPSPAPQAMDLPSDDIIDLSLECTTPVIGDTGREASSDGAMEIVEAPNPTPKTSIVKKRGRPKKLDPTNSCIEKKISKPGVRKGRVQNQNKKGRAKKQGPMVLADLASLFNHDIVAEAKANRELGAGPEFQGKNRRVALQTFIASMPEEARDLHNSDRKELEDAVKQFTLPCRLDGGGGWHIKGMQSSLHNYQVIGAGFMRLRESGKTLPLGGLLGDEMGFGKTIMTIAAILDGKSDKKARNKTTLIVATAALTTQWLQEIDKHAGTALGSVIVYRSGSRIMSNTPVAMLSSMDVVITSYQEVLRSMPKNEPPLELVTKEAKEQWWKNELRTKKGVLHQMTWHRIILDEAQAIKNRQSKTFDAVFELNAKYRWAVSGTPVQNSLDEFFPYFAFLRMPETGDYNLWKRNFCNKGSDKAQRRLAVILGKIMLRRTHASRLFGLPCIKLPNLEVNRIRVDFNDVERAIYRIVRCRFLSKVRSFKRSGALDQSYQQVFTLFLRLRQLVAHILLIQKTLKELLEPEDLEQLWRLTQEEKTRQTESGSVNMLQGLEQALSNVSPDDASRRRGNSDDIPTTPNATPLVDSQFASGQAGELTLKFRQCLQAMRHDGLWEKIAMRSQCAYCAHFPRDPYITSCMHIYCCSCLNSLAEDAALRQLPGPRCTDCGIEYLKAEPCIGFTEATSDCGTPVSTRSSLRPRRLGNDEEDIDWYRLPGPVAQSAKTRAATNQIHAWFEEDPKAKILVFTQFRGIIKIMERVCAENYWGCASFHGEMTFEARDKAVEKFTEDEECKILLAAMKAGGVGLNLAAANRCIIIDLWWNSSVEQQAFCRMFRIGQTRNVQVVRLTVNKSIDDDIIEMQDRKNSEIIPVVDQSIHPGRLTIRELMQLFGPVERDENGEIIADGKDDLFIFPNDPYVPRQDLDTLIH